MTPALGDTRQNMCNTPPAPQKYIENGLSVCVGKGTVLFITGALNAMTAVCY